MTCRPILVERLGIAMVPVYINVGDKSYLDGVDLTRQEFYENLPGYDVFPTTAAPAPGAFTAAYQALVDDGATEIISLHIATKLSNTLNAARLGAEDVEGRADHHVGYAAVGHGIRFAGDCCRRSGCRGLFHAGDSVLVARKKREDTYLC